MKNPWKVLAIALMGLVLLAGFGPFTNTIYRVWPGYSTVASVGNVAVSPTALATAVLPYNPERYAYSYYPYSANTPGGSVYACCSYGAGSGTPAAAPTAGSGNTCATGMYEATNTLISEQNAPAPAFYCVTSGGTISFSTVENK
jgi:hypothetical protein